MDEPAATAALWDYRRRVADLYAVVRSTPDPAEAWRLWRNGRNGLFATHPQSPLAAEAQRGFTGLPYFEYDPSCRVWGAIEPAEPVSLGMAHSGAGTTPLRRFGKVRFTVDGTGHTLNLYWIDTYGGGVFLPFRDATSGHATYGGGRYLLDTVKGADLGAGSNGVVLDFNFAYHPSCVHSPRWSCPLAPPSNRLSVAVRAGEKLG